MNTKLVRWSLLALVAACAPSRPPEATAPHPAAPAPTVKAFGAPPPVDQSSRTGTVAEQSFTPEARGKMLRREMRTRWAAHVGKTTFRSTMALAGNSLVIGSHGSSFDRPSESDDGVVVLDAKTGAVQRTIAAPGSGDRDVTGIAVDADRVFFTTDNRFVVAATLAGQTSWKVELKAAALSAPALADVARDGKLKVVVGDANGSVTAIDAATGKKEWERAISPWRAISAGVAVTDVDGDGADDVIVGSESGELVALKGKDGAPLWSAKKPGAIWAAPMLVDLDGGGHREVLAAWSEGYVAVVDHKTGKELWATRVEHDDGTPATLLAAPMPVPGPRIGYLIAPIATAFRKQGLVVLGEHERRFQADSGEVASHAVVATIDSDAPPAAIFGTLGGDVYAIDGLGGKTFLAAIGAPIEASPLLADVDADNKAELFVASNDGKLTCFTTGFVGVFVKRFRGESAHNRGELAPVNLGWSFARGRDAATNEKK